MSYTVNDNYVNGRRKVKLSLNVEVEKAAEVGSALVTKNVTRKALLLEVWGVIAEPTVEISESVEAVRVETDKKPFYVY